MIGCAPSDVRFYFIPKNYLAIAEVISTTSHPTLMPSADNLAPWAKSLQMQQPR